MACLKAVVVFTVQRIDELRSVPPSLKAFGSRAVMRALLSHLFDQRTTLEPFFPLDVENRMRLSTFGVMFVMFLAVSSGETYSQVDGLIAYVPAKPIERTADSERIGFMESAVSGKAEAILPMDALGADILNARGNIERSYSADQLGTLSLADIQSGTWTLRVHTSHGFLVRRFVVMARGGVIWSPDHDRYAKKRKRNRRH